MHEGAATARLYRVVFYLSNLYFSLFLSLLTHYHAIQSRGSGGLL